MDSVGDMLAQHLQLNSRDISVTQIRPAMRRRCSSIPLVGNTQLMLQADRLFNRFGDYPAQLRRRVNEFQLFHLVDHSYSQLIHVLPCERTIVTCHDLDSFRCLLEPEQQRRPLWFRAMTRRVFEGFRRAARVVCVSEATRRELLRHEVLPPDRIVMIHNGVDPACSPCPNPAADAEAARLLGNQSDTVWLLNVGSTVARKRIDILLRVFASIRRELPEARLVRVGGVFTVAQLQIVKELGLDQYITVLPLLDRNVLAAVYRRAALLLHTSEAEGFGMPLSEAMACGCVVVASDLPVLREVGGTAATYCPVGNVEVWKNAAVRLLREWQACGETWAIRREGAISHAARFSWAEHARQITQIYREVVAA